MTTTASPTVPATKIPQILGPARLGRRLALLTVLAATLKPGIGLDAWWHLAAGRWMVANGQILREDVFSFTRDGAAWVRPGWLADLAMYAGYQLGGMTLLNLTTALLLTGAIALAASRMRTGPAWLQTAAVLLAGLNVVIAAVPRPLVASVLLTSWFAVILDVERDRPTRLLWTLPLASALWVNLHGAFVVGVGLIGLHLTGLLIAALLRREALDRTRLPRLVAATVTSALALLANPFGWRLLTYPLDTMELSVLATSIGEWQPPDLSSLAGLPVLALACLLVVGLIRRGRPHPTEVLLVVVFGFLAFSAVRHTALLGVVALPVLGRVLSQSMHRADRAPVAGGDDRLWLAELGMQAAALVAVVIVGLSAVIPRGNDAATRDLIPVDAVDALVAEPGRHRVFAHYNWGGYILWRDWPASRTFVDGRTDLFGDELVGDYLDLVDGAPGWRRRFSALGIDTLMLDADAGLVDVARRDGWRMLHAAEDAVLLVRSR